MRDIKIIWDFRGPAALKTAEHHAIHLKEYAANCAIEYTTIDIQTFNEFYTIAFIVVKEKDMLSVRDALKPHRAEVYIKKRRD
ncbi:hypothetical protein [Neptunitalea lumnitzerae]|uniref:Uncharacterized protein n=1 Tax=Neptunitalea lumnitzerae TaxID=2965509 RepID=A0ABQ5MMG5_9FLAO|nr:hypothetical protein [Neptunitalea sp. Y10]GLB50501.1 hypothetical protein Y10_28690 [Neptunitalea sp. Y10]